MDGRQGHDDEEGAADCLFGAKVIEEEDTLHCLAQTHLVRQNRVGVMVPVKEKPIDTPTEQEADIEDIN